jgi:hypothetical protein
LDLRLIIAEGLFKATGDPRYAPPEILKAKVAQGSIGLNQAVDFHLGLQFTDPLILDRSTKLSHLKNILIDEIGMLSGEVRVSGTLQEPKYRYAPLPLNRLKGIFQNLF